MTPEHGRLLRELLMERRILSLAVVVQGRPVIGMLPFAVEPDWTALLVHASRLAPHAAGLGPGAAFAALIHQVDEITTPPGQLGRLRLEGTVDSLPRGSNGWNTGRELYLNRHPEAEVTFNLGDFELSRLVVATGRLVAGFASTANLKPDTLRRAATDARQSA
jgi:hypothetical protein